MIAFILKRLLWFPVMLLVITTVAFFVMKAVPGDPFSRENQNLAPEVRAQLEARYGLDQPVHIQYVRYLKGLVRGDFGPSIKYKDVAVAEIIAATFPVSLALGLLALIIAMVVGLTAGILAAIRQNTVTDYGFMGMALLGISIPNFVLATLLVALFSFTLEWLPVAGWGGWKELIMPALSIGLPYGAYIARIQRTGMIKVIRQDFIRTAHAKGVAEKDVVLGHALKVAILPVISYLGPATAGIVTGSLVVEKVFAIPGIGVMFVNSALNRDYMLVMGTIILYSTLLIALNLLVDVLYHYLDPRVDLEKSVG